MGMRRYRRRKPLLAGWTQRAAGTATNRTTQHPHRATTQQRGDDADMTATPNRRREQLLVGWKRGPTRTGTTRRGGRQQLQRDGGHKHHPSTPVRVTTWAERQRRETEWERDKDERTTTTTTIAAGTTAAASRLPSLRFAWGVSFFFFFLVSINIVAPPGFVRGFVF
jgi:hypothetical protein